jgi:hypothetical protein
MSSNRPSIRDALLLWMLSAGVTGMLGVRVAGTLLPRRRGPAEAAPLDGSPPADDAAVARLARARRVGIYRTLQRTTHLAARTMRQPDATLLLALDAALAKCAELEAAGHSVPATLGMIQIRPAPPRQAAPAPEAVPAAAPEPAPSQAAATEAGNGAPAASAEPAVASPPKPRPHRRHPPVNGRQAMRGPKARPA